MTPEDLLVEFAAASIREEPPPAIAEKIELHLLDTVSLAIGAASHPVVEAVSSLVAVSERGAALWTRPDRCSPVDAALVNGTAAHAHFADDTDMVAWAHPGSLICPVPVALASVRGLEYDAVLRGAAAGYATLSWLGADEEVSRAVVERGFRAGPTLGAVAAAVAGAVTLGLGSEATRWAIGIAADSTGALLEPVGSGAQDWRLQNGQSASLGTRAALLADAGVQGPPLPLTGRRGFLRAFTGSDSTPPRWTRPPTLDDVRRVWFKEFPTLGDNMAVAVAAREVHRALPGEIDEIDEIVVGMNAHFAAYPGTAYRGPFHTVDQAVASTAFAVSALLLRGALAWDDYPALLEDAALQRLIPFLRVEADPALSYTEGWVRVRQRGEHVRRSAADAPKTVFFRDRAAALAALARLDVHEETVAGLLPTRVVS